MFRRYFYTTYIGIKLCFDIRRKRVLLILFVLILNIKKLPAQLFHLIPRIYQGNIKNANHKKRVHEIRKILEHVNDVCHVTVLHYLA